MFWRIYSFLFALILIAGYSVVPFRGWEYIDFILTCTAFFGFSSFAFGKRVFRPWFWKVWLIIIIIWDFIYNVFIPSPMPNEFRNSFANYLLTLIILLPEYIGLYLYGYRNKVVDCSKKYPF